MPARPATPARPARMVSTIAHLKSVSRRLPPFLRDLDRREVRRDLAITSSWGPWGAPGGNPVYVRSHSPPLGRSLARKQRRHGAEDQRGEGETSGRVDCGGGVSR